MTDFDPGRLLATIDLVEEAGLCVEAAELRRLVHMEAAAIRFVEGQTSSHEFLADRLALRHANLLSPFLGRSRPCRVRDVRQPPEGAVTHER